MSLEPSASFYDVGTLPIRSPQQRPYGRAGVVSAGSRGGATSIPTPSAGTVQGTPPGIPRDALRIGTGSGAFAHGSPRQIEFGLKLNF